MEMLAKDDADSKGLGLVGTMSDEMLTEALFWRLVCNLRLSPKEIEEWTLNDMRKADAFMSMQMDYKRIWPVYFDLSKDEDGSEDPEAILEEGRMRNN
ncbi:MAG: hypothetical protein J6U20_04230 [Fibrobacter sp.]|nr:hypothetical protein [Fibrobacter sp.]